MGLIGRGTDIIMFWYGQYIRFGVVEYSCWTDFSRNMIYM